MILTIDETAFYGILKVKFDEQERPPALPKGNLI